MTTSKPVRPVRDGPREIAFAVQRDFRALLEIVNQQTGEKAHSLEIASIKASVERGIRLAGQLLDSIDGEGAIGR
jgi:hypothetical protein